MDWLADLVDRFLTDADDLARARRLLLAMAPGGTDGATAYLNACRLLGEAAADSGGLIAALDDGGGRPADRVGQIVIACFASVRAEYVARPDAQAARAALAARAERDTDAIGNAFGHEVHGWVTALIGTAIEQISAIAASRAPLVRVETGLSLPASFIAWDLYGDPNRDGELVERNRTGTAMVMPVILEAVAP